VLTALPLPLFTQVPRIGILRSSPFGHSRKFALEAVMNSIRNGLGMRETEIVKEPTRPWNPHFYAIFAQVHNTP
jgi:hypothetical protein